MEQLKQREQREQEQRAFWRDVIKQERKHEREQHEREQEQRKREREQREQEQREQEQRDRSIFAFDIKLFDIVKKHERKREQERKLGIIDLLAKIAKKADLGVYSNAIMQAHNEQERERQRALFIERKQREREQRKMTIVDVSDPEQVYRVASIAVYTTITNCIDPSRFTAKKQTANSANGEQANKRASNSGHEKILHEMRASLFNANGDPSMLFASVKNCLPACADIVNDVVLAMYEIANEQHTTTLNLAQEYSKREKSARAICLGEQQVWRTITTTVYRELCKVARRYVLNSAKKSRNIYIDALREVLNSIDPELESIEYANKLCAEIDAKLEQQEQREQEQRDREDVVDLISRLRLSAKQADILQLELLGYGIHIIARELGISENTVKSARREHKRKAQTMFEQHEQRKQEREQHEREQDNKREQREQEQRASWRLASDNKPLALDIVDRARVDIHMFDLVHLRKAQAHNRSIYPVISEQEQEQRKRDILRRRAQLIEQVEQHKQRKREQDNKRA